MTLSRGAWLALVGDGHQLAKSAPKVTVRIDGKLHCQGTSYVSTKIHLLVSLVRDGMTIEAHELRRDQPFIATTVAEAMTGAAREVAREISVDLDVAVSLK